MGWGAVFSIEATDVSGAASTGSVSAVETADGENFDINAQGSGSADMAQRLEAAGIPCEVIAG